MSTAIHTLLNGLIDYAGLFPPSAVSMEKAVANFARYKEGEDAFALARFILPVSRLHELADEMAKLGRVSEPWRLSVLSGHNLADDMKTVAEFNVANAERAIVDTFEVKAPDIGQVMHAAHLLPSTDTVYFEVSSAEEPRALITAIGEAGRRAKIRTGGVTRGAFPSASEIARFMARCISHMVPFKATAGLHHPIRCVRPLTYEPDSITGTMNGFVNVFLAATLLEGGATAEEVEPLLEDENARNFTLDGDAILWRDQRITTEALRRVRTGFAISFGSCSFEEPIEELRELGWL